MISHTLDIKTLSGYADYEKINLRREFVLREDNCLLKLNYLGTLKKYELSPTLKCRNSLNADEYKNYVFDLFEHTINPYLTKLSEGIKKENRKNFK